MEQYGPFIGGAALVILLGYIAYNIKKARDKKPSTTTPPGGQPKGPARQK